MNGMREYPFVPSIYRARIDCTASFGDPAISGAALLETNSLSHGERL